MRLLNFRDLRPEKRIYYSRDHVRRMVREGRFPRPIALSPHRIAWKESDIDDWLKSRPPAPISNPA